MKNIQRIVEMLDEKREAELAAQRLTKMQNIEKKLDNDDRERCDGVEFKTGFGAHYNVRDPELMQLLVAVAYGYYSDRLLILNMELTKAEEVLHNEQG